MEIVIHTCKKVCFGMKLLLAFFVFITGNSFLYSQNLPQEGMEVKQQNLSSFTQPQRTNDLSDWKKFNDPADYDHPEFGILVKDAPCASCVEVLSRRKEDERYFVNTEKPSEFYQQKALGDINMLLNGDWVTIDHTLRPAGTGVFESGYVLEQAVIDASDKRTHINTPSGPVYFNSWRLLTKTGSQETDRGIADWSDYTVGSDGMLIHNVFPGIDAELLVFRGTIKTNFILRTNEFGTFDELIFRDEFSAGAQTAISFSNNATISDGVGELSILSGGSELLHVGESILFARNGPKELVQSGSYRVNGNKMDVVVPFSWINANIGSYVLVVDPSVSGTATLAQASITGSRYNASCNFTNSCDYTLVVPRPANATINDVAWTFTYTANGTACYLQDGAIRIGVGSCISPSMAGYYWFCNAIGGGTCAGTNQTIFSDVSSCIPAPGCTPQNVTFTLKFYRSCWGATGCSNACIGAGSPWTMTITGNTLSYSNVTTPISLSGTTVCQGGSINASTSGTGGVPPYTYNWSFSPTGAPSVGTGASTSITFPTSGSTTLYSIVTDACGNTVTSSNAVTVTPGPTVTVTPSPSPTSAPGTICAGGSVVLNAAGATTYTWSPSTGLSATSGASVTASPATTTTYTVTGTTSGCSSTTTSTVTVNPIPVVTVNSASVCGGTPATLTATGAASYTWSPSAGLSATTGATVTANPSATTTYTVTGTTSGCSSTATSTVTINPMPVVTVNSETMCAGSSVTLTATGAASYTWSPSTGLSATAGATVTANPSATTTYTVTGTTSGCSSTAISTVTVNPQPVVTVNSETMCAGSSVTLNATGATSYSWSPATGLSATTGASVTANPSSTTTYTVTGTTSGCTSTATSTVTVSPMPVVTVNSETMCAGSPVTLTATGASSYAWSSSTGLSATTGATVTANPSATITYTVTGTTSGCSSTATSTVTVNPVPVVTVNSGTICAGDPPVTLTATGASSYSWSPATGLSATTGASVTANPSSTTTYTVTGTTSGCTGTATSTVTVSPMPAVTVNSETMCEGTSVTLTATGASSYAWSPSTGLSATTGATVTANPSATITYTVTGTTSGCSSTATSTVTVNPVPVVTVNSGTICAGDPPVTLTATGASSYSWSPAIGLSATTGASVTANPSSTTTYTVTGTSSGCTATATSTVTVNSLPAVGVTPASATVCSGVSTTLTASGASGYTWSPSTGLSATTGTSVTASPATTTTYTVTGTGSGCSSTATTTITVNPNPVVSVNSGSFCAGGSLQLNATGAASYSWSPSAGLSTTTGSPVTASPSSTTTYTVTGTTSGCSSTATSTVTVNPNPVLTVNSPAVCEGTTATLVASTGIASYSWSPSTGLSSTSGSTVTSNVATTTTYTVTGTSAEGCSNTATSTVTVNPLPSVTASNNGPLCPGDELDLTSTADAGATYSWSGPGSFGSSSQNPVIASVSSADAGTYTVQATLNGCSSSGTTTLTMNAGVPTTIDPVGPFCVNASPITLTAATSGGVWSGPGITDPSTGAFDPSAANGGANTVTYQVPGGCSDISTASIVVNPLPTVSFSADRTTGCLPLTVNFTNTSSSTGTLIWDFDGVSETGTGSTDDYTFTGSGCYTISLTLTDANGCQNQSQVANMICVSSVPDADFSVNSQEANISDPIFQFMNHSVNATAYSWEFGDGDGSTSVNSEHTFPAQAGNYTVWLYASNAAGCVDSVSKVVKVTDEVLFFVPNAFTPNGDEHNNTFQPVLTAGFDEFSYSMAIYNRWGEIVFESRNTDIGWDGTYNGVLAQEGTYTWTIQFRAKENDDKYKYAGSFTLLK